MFEFLACMHFYASVCVPGACGGRREYQFILLVTEESINSFHWLQSVLSLVLVSSVRAASILHSEPSPQPHSRPV